MTGAANSRRRLSDEQVADIRRRYLSGEREQKDLAAEYGVALSTVSMIVNGHRRAGKRAPRISTEERQRRAGVPWNERLENRG